MRNTWQKTLKSLAFVGSIVALTNCSSLDSDSISNPVSYKNKQLKCMAEAIHGEARGEPEEGKIFVGRVIITRVKQGYGPNYCSVVYAKRQFAPKKSPSRPSIIAAIKSEKLGPNGITHFHSYKNQKTSNARFSQSPLCVPRGKVGGHWGFACGNTRSPTSRQVSNDYDE